MTGLLLDTHVALWLLQDSPRLGAECRRLIEGADRCFLSAASRWELAIKSSVGKIQLSEGFDGAVAASGLCDLPVTGAHAAAVELAVLPHRDPFDALLVAQAQAEQLVLVTADKKLLDALAGAVDARH